MVLSIYTETSRKETLTTDSVAVKQVTFDALPLERGGILRSVTIAYETWGQLSPARDNVILITHALTANSHAHDTQEPDNSKAAWWNLLIGPGRVFDTDRYYIICSNVLGGCNGSTGPSSINPQTGTPYGMRFPIVTIGDMVHAQHKLLTSLGISQLALVVGGSIGGLQALEWAVRYPDFVRKAAIVAATAALSAQGIAFSEIGRQMIMSDPDWLCGDYATTRGPRIGLAIARMLAVTTYQSSESMEMRFARRPSQRGEILSPSWSPDLGQRFDVEGYLYYQGHALNERHFDANSYLYLTKAMDLYDVSAGYASIEEAVKRIQGKALFVGIRSDMLFPAAAIQWLAEKVQTVGGDATYAELDSPYGHDAFLKEWDLLASALQWIEE